MVRKPADQRVVDRIPNSCHEQDAAGDPGIHPGDIRKEDELEKNNRAPGHSRTQLACPIGQTLKVSELRGISPHCAAKGNGELMTKRLLIALAMFSELVGSCAADRSQEPFPRSLSSIFI